MAIYCTDRGCGRQVAIIGWDTVQASFLCTPGLGFQKRQCSQNYHSSDKLASNVFGVGAEYLISCWHRGYGHMYLLSSSIQQPSGPSIPSLLLSNRPPVLFRATICQVKNILISILPCSQSSCVNLLWSTSQKQNSTGQATIFLKKRNRFSWYVLCPLLFSFLLHDRCNTQRGNGHPAPDPEDKSHKLGMVQLEARRKLS